MQSKMTTASDVEDAGVPAKAARTMTTLGLVVVGFFWTSGGFYVRISDLLYCPNRKVLHLYVTFFATAIH